MTDTLSIPQARTLALSAQRLPPAQSTDSPEQATLAAIEHLGYIQIDTISAVQRAHHHTLWNRNPNYQPAQLERLIANKNVFEYWSHAAAYLPLRDYRHTLPRKHAIATGQQKHWYERDEQLMQSVLRRIENEGPLMAKDFNVTGENVGGWGIKPAKRALEYLFMQGDLMVPKRINFHKVYDLTARVLPTEIDTTLPSPAEHARFLIIRYLTANGIGQASEIAYLLKNTRPLITAALQEMVLSGDVIPVQVDATRYYALPASLEQLNRSRAHGPLKILSPFDNLLIQRKRMRALFNFDYQLECYIPAAKRKFGYFVLPILWDGRLVARMDCKADRKTGCFHILHLALEPNLKDIDSFALALHHALPEFRHVNGCSTLEWHRTTPSRFQRLFESARS